MAKRRVKDQVKEPKIIVSIRNAQNLPVRINKYDEEVSECVAVYLMYKFEQASVQVKKVYLTACKFGQGILVLTRPSAGWPLTSGPV